MNFFSATLRLFRWHWVAVTMAGAATTSFAQTEPADKPAVVRPANPAAETDDKASAEKPTQYTKNVSPSGLALGVLDARVDGGGLPEEVKKLAEEGALASADRDWKKAQSIYQKMVQKAPRNALAFANLGVVEYRLENYEAARAALNRSLHLNPSISQNWLTLGRIQHKEGKLELAISSLTRALHEDPRDPRTRLYLAIAAYDYGWGATAETELLRAIQIDENYADAHFNLALMYLEKKPPAVELARRHYYRAVDLGSKPDREIEAQLKFESKKAAAAAGEKAPADDAGKSQ